MSKIKKYIFLDFNGVIIPKKPKDVRNGSWFNVSTHAIKQLNRLVAFTGAEVVVSSNWRLMCSTDTLRTLLEDVGFCGQVAGKTPDLYEYRNGGFTGSRHDEITDWLGVNIPMHADCRYVILDDRSDALLSKNKSFFQCNSTHGLTHKVVNKAIAHLNS